MEPEQHGEEQKDVGIILSSSPRILGNITTFLGGEHVPDVQEVQAFVMVDYNIWLWFDIYNSRRKEKEKQRQEEETQRQVDERGRRGSRCSRGTTEAEQKFFRELGQEVEAIEEEWRRRGQCFTCDRVASEGPCEDCGALVCWGCSNRSSVYTAATAATLCHRCRADERGPRGVSEEHLGSPWPWYMRR